MNTIQTFDVVGMTCDHCTRSVGNEIRKIGGVDDVSVDLVTGVVTITSNGDVAVTDVVAAVTEAGYALAD